MLRKERLGYMVQTLAEMSHVWFKDINSLRGKLVNQYDNTSFERAVEEGSGVIILSPHIGNWEMMNVYLSQFRTLTVMYRPIKNSILDDIVRKARTRLGSVLVPTDLRGILKISRALNNLGMIAFLPDQVPELGSGVFSPLFKQQAYTMTLAHKLALKNKAKVFMGTAYQHEKGFAVCMEPLDEAFYDDDSVVAATCLNQSLEKAILRSPVQNQWEYKRYRVQPNDKASLYK